MQFPLPPFYSPKNYRNNRVIDPWSRDVFAAFDEKISIGHESKKSFNKYLKRPFVEFQLAAEPATEQLATPTPRLWTICWLFLCLLRWVASRLIFLCCLSREKKKGFIHKHISRWRALCVRLIHEIWFSASSKLKSRRTRNARNVEINFYHSKFEYSMKLTQREEENRLNKLTIWRQMKDKSASPRTFLQALLFLSN